jgi:hypothetical protein
MRSYIQLFLFPLRVCPVSNSNPRSDVSVFGSETGHYPLQSESEKYVAKDMVWVKSDPITTLLPLKNIGKVLNPRFELCGLGVTILLTIQP